MKCHTICSTRLKKKILKLKQKIHTDNELLELLDLITLKSLLEYGYKISDFKLANISIAKMAQNGASAQLLLRGYTIIEIISSGLFKKIQLQCAGCSILKLINIGSNVLLDNEITIQLLYNIGYRTHEIKQIGFTYQHFIDADYSVEKCKHMFF
jgi:hypothetical protein